MICENPDCDNEQSAGITLGWLLCQECSAVLGMSNMELRKVIEFLKNERGEQ